MESINRKTAQEIREQVISFLLFLTSETCLKSCYRYMPAEKFNFELCRVWFEEIYAPGRRYLTTLKGDFSEEAARFFQTCFTEEEFQSLERFHRFWELRLDMLAEKCRQQGIFPDNDSWGNLRRDARYLVETLEPDKRRRRTLLERLMKRFFERGEKLAGPFQRRIIPGFENNS